MLKLKVTVFMRGKKQELIVKCVEVAYNENFIAVHNSGDRSRGRRRPGSSPG
jgi:hypothetical protein